MIRKSYIAENRPTKGASPNTDKQDEAALIGGNKHTGTGGSADEYSDRQNECTQNARGNYGIDTPALEYEDNFSEGDYPGEEKSIGATMDSGSID